MNKNTKGILAVLIVGGIVFAVYQLTRKKTKKEMVEFITKSGYHPNPDALMTLGDDYIQAWFFAAKKDEPSFMLDGKKYKTQGGKLD